MLTLLRFARFYAEIKANGSCRSLKPRLIQRLYRTLRALPVREDHSSSTAFILTLESWLAHGEFDKVLAASADETDLRIQDVKFRAQHYRTHGIPDISAMGFELRGKTCSIPFSKLDVLPSGTCHLCCAVWQRQPVGNIFRQSINDVWNSSEAREIREGVNDGTFRYCGKQLCALIAARTLPVHEQTQVLSVGPKHFNLSYDRSCNLSCPSCRSEKIMEAGAKRLFLEKMTNDKILPLLKTGESVHITGSGDPFASYAFRHLLQSLNSKDYPALRIRLMTNGLLLTEAEWEKFSHLHGMIAAVNVSVDAVKPETYAIVRRGGDLNTLIPNLEFIGRLRTARAIDRYLLAFVVQTANFREMPDFIQLARRVGADQVHFQRLVDWNSMNPDDFHSASIQTREHPEHAEFMDTIRRPEFSDPFVVHEFAELLEGD